jgi:hypothetical protein
MDLDNPQRLLAHLVSLQETKKGPISPIRPERGGGAKKYCFAHLHSGALLLHEPLYVIFFASQGGLDRNDCGRQGTVVAEAAFFASAKQFEDLRGDSHLSDPERAAIPLIHARLCLLRSNRTHGPPRDLS